MPVRASQRVSTQLARALRSRRYATSTTLTGSRVNYDVVIVGGGPAGLALASALASSPHTKGQLDVAIVEAGDLSKIREWQMPGDAYSNRVSSLTNISEDFLKSAGIWRHIAQERTCPIEDMQVWDGISDARIEFGAHGLGIGLSSATDAPYMARMTENLNLQRAALRHLDEHPFIRILDKTKVETISNDEDGGDWPLVHLSSGQVLRTRLLIGADGFNSPVRAFAGIKSYGWAYPTHAIVATLQHSPRSMGPNTTAYQRFLPTGPIAFLPLSRTASSLVWSTRPALAAALTKADPAILVNMINAAFRLPETSMRYLHDRIEEAVQSGLPLQADAFRQEIAWRESSHQIAPHSPLASATVDPSAANQGIPAADADMFPPLVHSLQPGTVASFPLRFSHCESYLGEGKGARTVLVGDAAHTVHPLAGQGLNGGLSDVECLARCIQSAISAGGDIGSHTALQPYARERYIQNHSMISAVDKLHKLYSSQLTPVVWARSVGVEVLNELDTLKAAAMLGAGTEHGPSHAGTPGWNMFASGLESVGTGVRVARALGKGLQGVTANALRQAATALQR
ncbi:ubiquinone biosynthesis hydrox [Peniophora sp. CONT]|nr:ubiquinone biosynthesis hydrox [Peniophora sp. CONT]